MVGDLWKEKFIKQNLMLCLLHLHEDYRASIFVRQSDFRQQILWNHSLKVEYCNDLVVLDLDYVDSGDGV